MPLLIHAVQVPKESQNLRSVTETEQLLAFLSLTVHIFIAPTPMANFTGGRRVFISVCTFHFRLYLPT